MKKLLLFTFLFASFSVFGQNINYIPEADKLFEQGDYVEARKKYTAELALNDSNAHATRRIQQCDQCVELLAIANYLFSSGDYSNAKEQYEKILAINSKDPNAAARLRQIPTERGVTINGITWATRNVGARGTFVANPWDYGNYYTFDEAQTACPSGWRLPTTEEFESLKRAGSEWIAVNGVSGRRFGSGNHSVFFPATGYRHWSNGTLNSVGSYGHYWSATPSSTTYGRYLNFNATSVYPNLNYSRANGFAARCLSE